MQVRDGMTATVLVVGPGHTLRQTAKLMRERKVGAAVVHDDGGQGPSILTERDILESVALGQDPDVKAGWLFVLGFLAAAGSCRRAMRGQAGAPAAAQRRGGTSLTPASGGR